MSIGQKIKDARKEKGYTQEALGKLIGRTKGTIANYENGVSSPSVDDISALMSALNIDANFLYDWAKEKSATSGDGLSERLCIFNGLSPEAQEEALRYMQYLADKEAAK